MQDAPSMASTELAGAYTLISARVDDTLVFDAAEKKLGSVHAIHFEIGRAHV